MRNLNVLMRNDVGADALHMFSSPETVRVRGRVRWEMGPNL